MANLFSLAPGASRILKAVLGGTALGALSTALIAALAQAMAGEKMKIATIGAGREGRRARHLVRQGLPPW